MKKISGFILIILLASCSANYHLRKAIKKGYKCDEVADTIRITTVDSFPVIRDNQIVYERYFTTKDTIVQYKTSFVPKTRYQTRIEYKLKRDTLRLTEKVEVIKYKKERNSNKKPNLWLFIIGFGAGFITKWLLKFSKYTL
jgi:5-formaminoimidazole-4-carboxamide-1-beta-D-ribofuranosyl 5'-monophosphate synthetase